MGLPRGGRQGLCPRLWRVGLASERHVQARHGHSPRRCHRPLLWLLSSRFGERSPKTWFSRRVAHLLFFFLQCSLFRLLASVKTGRLATDVLRRFVNAVAGFVSGAIFSCVDTEVRQAVFVLWIVIRALRALLPAVAYSDLIIMMFSTSNILATYVHRPTDHSKSYQGFLHKFGGKSVSQLAPFHVESGEGPAPICDTIHAGQSCVPHLLTFTAEGMLRAVPLYLPVHLVGMLLSSHKSPALLASNVLRSSMFLSLYCSSAWYAACQYYKWLPFGSSSRFKTLFVEWIPGIAVLVERPSRRRELASYCLSHALNAYWNWAKRGLGLQSRDWVSVLLLSLSFGILLQHFEEQPNAITSVCFGITEYPVTLRQGGAKIGNNK